ncbi:MAG: hypothetical protein AMXMBFR13_06900 [Phycisphaerae bacterium]
MDTREIYMTKQVGPGQYECYGRNYQFLGRLDEQGMGQLRSSREAVEFWPDHKGGTNDEGQILAGNATWWRSVYPCGPRSYVVPHVWRTGLS